MKNAFLRKTIGMVVVAATITTLAPLGVSAQWKQSTDNTWSYAEGNKNVKGWKKINDNWYYFDSTGKMKTGWLKDCGNWYYNDNSGSMKTGWVKDNGTWYYNDNSGAMKTGWINDNNTWYYMDKSGAMQTGVVKTGGKIYSLDKSGAMQTGKIKIGNKDCTFATNGEVTGNNIPNCDRDFDKTDNTITSDQPQNDQNSNGTSNTTTNNQESVSNSGTTTNSGTITTPNSDTTINSSTTIPNSGTATINSGTTPNSGTTTNTTQDINSTNGDTVSVSGLNKLPQTYAISIQSSAENKILELLNQKRVEAGLKPLTMDNTLLQVARYKSDCMIQYKYFDHTNPDGTKWFDWLKTIGYTYNATAENIAYNTYDPVELFNQWWNSPGHKANMMNASYNKIGIGVIYDKTNNKYMGTQTFSN
ncbi:CAP domain-containing protein [Clostridium uliginosum]|uniref:Putative cell wall binding repeat-containing protein n=1 Tax=Clostridium uliginosum TaxID=119641 RepID=A0A1I1RAG4_9CLOT|nr:CAP domain-containing protein [Clostridium uliginosum]SFD31269.1 Putative cell wall binding repeat-containing protein [Clostridium uliginosum]